MSQRASLGRIVLFHARHFDVPAIVTMVYTDGEQVDLTAFYPESYPGLDDSTGQKRAPAAMCWARAVKGAHFGTAPGCWSWPTMLGAETGTDNRP